MPDCKLCGGTGQIVVAYDPETNGYDTRDCPNPDHAIPLLETVSA